MRKQFHIPELACEHCAHALERVLFDVPGVQDVCVQLDSREIQVHCEDHVSDVLLLAAIREVGYQAEG